MLTPQSSYTRDIELAIRQLGKKWRVDPTQVKIISDILHAFTKHDDVVLEAPTGIGKSLIAAVVASFFDTAYLATAEKILQHQYKSDFRCDLIMGADNYACSRFDTTVAASPCRMLSGLKAECGATCEYVQLRQRAQHSKLLLSNYHYFILEFDFVDVFPTKELAIFDEVHTSEMLLYDYAAVLFSTSTTQIIRDLRDTFLKAEVIELIPDHQWYVHKLNALLQLEPPYDQSTTATLRAFAQLYEPLVAINKRLSDDLRTVLGGLNLEDLSDEDLVAMKEIGVIDVIRASWAVGRCNCKWSNYKNHRGLQWLVDADDSGVKLVPSEAGFYSKQTLQRMGQKRLWMSATIGYPKTFVRSHALEKPAVFQIPSPFAPANRRVYTVGHHRVNRAFTQSASKMKLLADDILKLIRLHPCQNVVIHSGTYAVTRTIGPRLKKELQRLGVLVHLHDKPADRQRHVDRFIANGGVLISPTVTQGLDFKDDIARVQIVAKVPYLSLSSVLILHKMKADPTWYTNRACIQFIQSVGRSVRHEHDYAVTYVVDNNVDLLRPFLPPWFKLERFSHPAEAKKKSSFNLALLADSTPIA